MQYKISLCNFRKIFNPMKMYLIVFIIFFVSKSVSQFEEFPRFQIEERKINREKMKFSKAKSLDITEFIYKYGVPEKKGIKIATTKFDTLGNPIDDIENDSLGIFKTKHKVKYDSLGNLLEDVETDKGNNTVSKVMYEYDSSRNNIKQLFFNSLGRIESKIEFAYSSNNLLLQSTEVDSMGKDLQKKLYKYEEFKEQIITQRDSITFDTTYKVKNLLNEVEIKNYSNTQKDELFGKRKSTNNNGEIINYIYGIDGKVLEKIEKTLDGKLILTTQYTYTENGKVFEIIKTKTPEVKSRRKVEHTKTPDGRSFEIVKGGSTSGNLSSKFDEKNIFFYDGNENLIVSYKFDGSNNLIEKKFFKYNNIGNLVEEILFNVKIDEPYKLTKYDYK